MKRLMVAATAAFAAMAACAEMKIGTVEMMTLVRNHPRYESNRKLLVDTEKDYQKKLDGMKSEMDRLQEEGQKLAEQYRSPILSAAAKSDLEKQLTELQQKLVAGQQRLRSEAMRSQQELQDTEARLLKLVTEELRESIRKFAKDGGYDLVLDSSAVPFAKGSFDVTPGVLKAMGVDPEKARAKEDEGK